MTSITLEKLKKALTSLETGFKPNPNELERDGLIQRFEFCVELSWKSAKKILSLNSIESDTPKNVFRELAQLGWIENPDLWIEFLAQRNKASHIYNEEIALEVFNIIPSFILESKKLLETLESKK